MFEIQTEIVIDAPPARVWKTLTDFTTFPLWNPFMLAVDGEPKKGARLKVTLRTAGGGDMTFRPAFSMASITSRSRSAAFWCRGSSRASTATRGRLSWP